jgi:2-iminobutanoate/2-iminopropanoate deaminase
MTVAITRIREVGGRPPSSVPLSPATTHGDLVFCAGQCGFVPGSTTVVDGGVGAQTTQALENLREVLAAAGSSPDRVLKTLVFLADADDFAEFNRAYAEFFPGENYPARSTVVTGFVSAGVLVEIECVAARA